MKITEKFCTFAGHEISFYEAGSGHKTLLFLHGFPMNKSLWRSQIETLSDDYHCIAPDLTGFGNSVAPADYKASINRFADEMALILKSKASGPVTVVGLSMGGMIALALAVRHPNLVRGLVLMHTNAHADNEEERASRDNDIEAILSEGREAFARDFTNLIMGKNASIQARAKNLTMIENTSYEALTTGLEALRDRPSSVSELSSIDIPTLVLAGADDTHTTPDTMALMARKIPGAKLKVLENVGHMSAIENAAFINETLGDWLLDAFDLRHTQEASYSNSAQLH